MSRSFLPRRRTRAREVALQILYSLNVREGLEPDEAISLFPFKDEEPDVASYAIKLIKGVWSNSEKIDMLIRTYITGWRPERMVMVDLVAIRLALYEGWIAKKVPVAVAISEAVELAKHFGTEDSGRFVNGVLGRIVRSLQEESKDNNEPES